MELRFSPLPSEPTDSEQVEPPAPPVPPGAPSGAGAGGQPDGNEYLNELQHSKWSWIIEEILRQEEIRKAEYEKNARAEKINRYLAPTSSPLRGYGRNFIDAGDRTGVNPYLLCALTSRETSLGTNGYTCAYFNYWCMKSNEWTRSVGIGGSGNGWCAWPDIPTAISGAADFVLHFWGPAQTAHDTKGYCEGHPAEWVRAVEGCRQRIDAVEVPPYNPNPLAEAVAGMGG